MTQKLFTPNDIAEKFLEQYRNFKNNGTIKGPIFDVPTSTAMINSIKANPIDMVTFYIQAAYLIRNELEIECGEGSPDVADGVGQFYSVMIGWFTPIVSSLLNANDTLIERTEPEFSNSLPIPDGDPSDIFKNIEGFNFPEWIDDESEWN